MKRHCRSGYTLIEVLTAAILVGVGITAAVSMSSTMMMQEELSWRVAVAVNFQENSCRLWQLGLTPADVTAVMPDTRGNPFLGSILQSLPSNTSLGVASQSSMGVLEGAVNSAQVRNYSSGDDGATTSVQPYRATTVGKSTEP